jgi:hypothetical protein
LNPYSPPDDTPCDCGKVQLGSVGFSMLVVILMLLIGYVTGILDFVLAKDFERSSLSRIPLAILVFCGGAITQRLIDSFERDLK